MTMSRDRVHFEISSALLHASSPAIRSAFRKAFGVPWPFKAVPAWSTQGMTVICRPSQFARFLVYRNLEGGTNSFKDLNPRLLPAEETKKVFDVSGNQHEDIKDEEL